MRWRHVPQYCPAHCHNHMPQGPPNDRGSPKVRGRLKVTQHVQVAATSNVEIRAHRHWPVEYGTFIQNHDAQSVTSGDWKGSSTLP